MAPGPREHRTRIQIDPEGNWTIDGALIDNSAILQYFKKNLHRDEQGFYIFNEFGSLQEKGYLEVEGPVMRVLKLEENGFLLESGEHIKTDAAEIAAILPGRERVYLKLPNLGAWAIFARQAVVDLSERLYRKEESYYWGDKRLEMISSLPAVLPWKKNK